MYYLYIVKQLKTNQMETKIKEVQNYFKSKLLCLDCDITDVTQYYINIEINKHKFVIWAENLNIPTARKQSSDVKYNFMDLEITDEEATQLHELLLPKIKEFRKNILLEQKRKELEQLEKE